jgi:hypothetical protein
VKLPFTSIEPAVAVRLPPDIKRVVPTEKVELFKTRLAPPFIVILPPARKSKLELTVLKVKLALPLASRARMSSILD